MEIGISTASFFTRLYTEEAIVPIAKMGAEVCEIFFATHSEYTRKFGNVINKRLKEAQEYSPLKVHSVHALTNQFEPELFSVNERAYNDALEVFENVLKVARQVGASNYTFHGATMLKKAVKYSFNYEHISERVNYLTELAASYDVQFCYENVHWAYFCTPEYFETLKKNCPHVGAVLDIKQAIQSKIDYTQYLNAMGGRLKTVHLCDVDKNGNVELPGRGVFDFVTLFKRLKDKNFDGSCMLEVYAKNYKVFLELKESYEYVKDCLVRSYNN